jgi:xanthine dehydrogenase accessory factor
MVGRLGKADEPLMLVTVVETAGSAPRDSGARMVVGQDGMFGTIGGGQLEFEAIAEARNRLVGAHESGIVTYPLGPELGQCCGGTVTVLFESFGGDDKQHLDELMDWAAKGPVARAVRYQSGRPGMRIVASRRTQDGGSLDALAGDALESGEVRFAGADGEVTFAEPVGETRPYLWLFGAGHVGKAVIAAVANLPLKVTWVDGRKDMYPEDIPAGVEVLVVSRPELAVRDAPAGAYFLVMTHSHPLDRDICEAVLRRGDSAYLGLIGSKTKKAQFLSRLGSKGLSGSELEHMTCPIGLASIKGKAPAVIAVSIAADLMTRVSAAKP